MTSIPPQTPRIPDGALLNNRYRITGFLGLGGHAAVYAAVDTLIERDVAVKVLYLLSEDNTSPEHHSRLERFRAEARLAAKIRHPAVVTIFDMGTIDQLGFPFIVMEHLAGHDLRAELRANGPLHPERALRIIKPCLDALHAGHEQDVVHRDLKPANIFLLHPGTDREEVRILDFGIARALHSDARLTGAGQLLGTPRYLAPEYIREHRVTPALDIYQSGLILAELLLGAPVLTSPDAMECIIRHTQGNLGIAPWLLDSPWGPLIQRATARRPADRFPSALEFRRALDALDPKLLPAPPAPTAPLPDPGADHSIQITVTEEDTPKRAANRPHRLDATTQLPPQPLPRPRHHLALAAAAVAALALIAAALAWLLSLR